MRLALISLVAACAMDPAPALPPSPEPPRLPDEAWAGAMRPGDLVVLVPGTGSYDYLAAPIEALPGDHPLVDVHAVPKVADDAVVFEQAIAAAHRAGVANGDLESGAITFVLWGAGFTRLTGFVYASYEGLHIPVAILGGKNSCAVGLVADNLFHYTLPNVTADATDLDARMHAWLSAHPATRNVVVASHSWGSAIAEYRALEVADLEPAGSAPVGLTIAMGVPAWVVGYTFAGPSVDDTAGGVVFEIDRPDDPVHAMNPSGNPDGHQYDILFGDSFEGSYGITTESISCRGAPGACPAP